MPSAPKFNPTDSIDLDLCRTFVAKVLTESFGSPIIKRTDGMLENDSSKATYIVVPGWVSTDRYIHANAHNSWLGLSPSWFAVLDVLSSEIYLIHRETFSKHMNPSYGITSKNVGEKQVEYRISLEMATQTGVLRKNVHGLLDGDPFAQYRGIARAVKEKLCHLHNHSNYSLLDGASTIEGIVNRAVLNGQPGIALTDHGVMFGLWKFYIQCKEAGITPVLGMEAYMVDDVNNYYFDTEGKKRRFEYHQTILAMNEVGFHNLSKLSSKAFRDHYYYVPRIDHKMLFEHNEGLIVLSGCFKGMVAWHLQEFEKPIDGTELPYWYQTNPDRSRQIMRAYKHTFGDRYFAEIMGIDFGRYIKCMPKIAQMAEDVGVELVPTNDNHYELAEDAAMQSMLTRVSNSKVDEIGDVTQKTGVYYIKSRDQMDRQGIITDAMMDRTVEIMERCKFDFPKGFLFPRYPNEKDTDWNAFQEQRKAA